MGHIHKLYDFTVSAFIVYNDRILLLYHKKLNTWLQPGGHIELDEDPEQALYREIEEETSLKRSDLELIELATTRPKSPTSKSLPIPFDLNVHPFGEHPTHKHIDLCYLIQSTTNVINQNITESSDLRWFSKEEITVMKAELLPDIYERCMFVFDYMS